MNPTTELKPKDAYAGLFQEVGKRGESKTPYIDRNKNIKILTSKKKTFFRHNKWIRIINEIYIQSSVKNTY